MLTIVCFPLILVSLPPKCFGSENGSSDLLFKPSSEGFVTSWLQLGAVTSPPRLKKQKEQFAAWDPLGIADLKNPPRAGDTSVGRRWKARYSSSKRLKFRGTRPATVYLGALVRSRVKQLIWLSTGSDSGIEIWLNGHCLLNRHLKRRAVPDTDLTALNLASGDNLLIIKLSKFNPRRQWRLYARLMDEHFTPPEDITIVLPGAANSFADAFKKTGRLAIDRNLNSDAGAIDVSIKLKFRGGRPIGEPAAKKIAFTGPTRPEAIEGTIDLSIDKPADLELGTFRFDGENSPSFVQVRIGSNELKESLAFRMRDVAGLLKAIGHLNIASKRDDLEKTSFESIAWRIEHLKSLIENGDRDYKYFTREIKETKAMAKALADGKDPYRGRRGEVQRRGYLSKLDGSYNYYALYVPPGWREDGEQRYGLVVSLHGLNGSPMKNMLTIFGKPRREGEQKIERERHPEKVGRSRFFVLSPSGFGNSGYRAFGEIDVLDAIEQVRERYRIDPDRIYITGLSMGGIGSASIPLHKPDLFAAAAPLCGYHSLFLYRSLKRSKLKPWEKFLASFRSNKDWALNGKYLPLHIVHGLKDNPRHSSVLVEAYKKLGYKVSYENPNEGHNIWDQTYNDRWIFTHFARIKRKTHPSKVVLNTSRLRYRNAHWIRIDDAVDYAKWTKIEATWDKKNEIHIKTDNVAALTAQNDPILKVDKDAVLFIDEQKFEAVSDVEHWQFYHNGETWIQEPKPKCENLCKRPDLAGPMGDAFYEPLIFVFGTGNPGEATLARRLIEELRKPWSGVTVDWIVKADVDVTKDDIDNYSLVLVGTPQGNSLISQVSDQLPIRVTDESVTIGDQEFKGRNVAASFIYPNPLNPDRYAVVHTGVTKEALYHVAHLPRLVPDYVIYDASSWGRKGGRVLGDRRDVLSGGFFDKNWQVSRVDPKMFQTSSPKQYTCQ
ncbi:MAG: prolyl oligopeptidase family serine peptidase [Proteobacteria bacterium]|nr:prolyl oligopeptidase family serine peptidase [Pseudomonadota bacterium]